MSHKPIAGKVLKSIKERGEEGMGRENEEEKIENTELRAGGQAGC